MGPLAVALLFTAGFFAVLFFIWRFENAHQKK